jgi:hypothetical protein
MDQLWNDRRPGKELTYYQWERVTSVTVEKEIKKNNNSRTLSDSSWQTRMMDPDLPQRDNVPSPQYQVQPLWGIRRICHCLTGWARHDIHPEYDTKCLDMFTAIYGGALKKRSPNLTEFLAADEHIWTMPGGILQLVNSGEWSFSEVLHDIVHNRRDIELFMGPQSVYEPSGKGKGNKSNTSQFQVKKNAIWKEGKGSWNNPGGGRDGGWNNSGGGRAVKGTKGKQGKKGKKGAASGAAAKAESKGGAPNNWPKNWGVQL